MMDKLKAHSPLLLIGIFIVGIFIGSSSTMLVVQKSQSQIPLVSPTSLIPLSCTYKNRTYKQGEGFKDDCNSCTCQNGQVTCTEMACGSGGEQPAGGIVGTQTSTVQPINPVETGLYKYPDHSLNIIPTTPISVKYLIEHRSALNEKTISLTGTIITMMPQEKTCPNSINGAAVGMCGQPFLVLADTTDEARDKNYDLVIRVGEDAEAAEYPIGKTVQIKVTIYADKTSINVIEGKQ